MCLCDYCVQGPFHDDDGRVVHFCWECRVEYLEDCPGCAAYDYRENEWKEKEKP